MEENRTWGRSGVTIMCMFLDRGRKWQWSLCLMRSVFIGCYMFRRPRRLASISNLPAIRTLSSGEVFCKLSVDDWLKKGQERGQSPLKTWPTRTSLGFTVILPRLCPSVEIAAVLCQASAIFMPHFSKTTRWIGNNLVGKRHSWDTNKWPAETFFPWVRVEVWFPPSSPVCCSFQTIPLCFPLQNVMDIIPHHHSVTLSQRSGGGCLAALIQDGLFGCFRQLGKWRRLTQKLWEQVINKPYIRSESADETLTRIQGLPQLWLPRVTVLWRNS